VTTFLLKLHCKNDIGGAEPRPTTSGQWEGARLRFKSPSRIGGGRGDIVVEGDTLVVWTHEDPAFGGGQGLTAEGVARNVREEPDNTLSATLEHVRLFKPGFRLRGWRGGSTGSRVIDYLLRNLLTRTYELTEDELSEFLHVVDRHMQQAAPVGGSASDEDEALREQKEAVLEGFERRYSRQEVRPDQADFRASLFSRYKGKCAVTGCNVEATLQAAHVVPFSESIALRNEPSNGLLLRADVHALLDKALLSIDPENNRVVLCDSLQDTLYWSLKWNTIDPAPAKPYLEALFRFFKKKQSQR
jgi:hypothetical protein